MSRLSRAGGQNRECGAGPLGKGWGHRAEGRGWPGQGPPNQGGFGRGSSSPQTAPSAVRPRACKGSGPKGWDSSVLTSGPLCETGAAPRPLHLLLGLSRGPRSPTPGSAPPKALPSSGMARWPPTWWFRPEPGLTLRPPVFPRHNRSSRTGPHGPFFTFSRQTRSLLTGPPPWLFPKWQPCLRHKTLTRPGPWRIPGSEEGQAGWRGLRVGTARTRRLSFLLGGSASPRPAVRTPADVRPSLPASGPEFPQHGRWAL